MQLHKHALGYLMVQQVLIAYSRIFRFLFVYFLFTIFSTTC